MRPRNCTSLVILCLSFGCALSSSRILAEEAGHVVTSPSSGEYQIVWLQLDQGGVAFDSKKRERFDVSLFLGLRNGKAVVGWFVHPALSGGRVVWLDASTLKLSETQLRGAFQGRTNRHWGDKNIHYFDYSIDSVVGDGEARKPAASAIPERPRETAAACLSVRHDRHRDRAPQTTPVVHTPWHSQNDHATIR